MSNWEDPISLPPVPPHWGFHLGTNYTTDQSPADFGQRDYIQYSNHVNDTERWASYGSLLYQPACCYEYSIETLNLAGPFPRVSCVLPFWTDPYSYQWHHFDEWGNLGKFKWTQWTQLLPTDSNFPLHRAFIPFNNSIFNFDLHSHLALARGHDPSLWVLKRGYLECSISMGTELMLCFQRIWTITSHTQVELLSELDPNWHFRSSWMLRAIHSMRRWLCNQVEYEGRNLYLIDEEWAKHELCKHEVAR
jgi:hypothetical protein